MKKNKILIYIISWMICFIILTTIVITSTLWEVLIIRLVIFFISLGIIDMITFFILGKYRKKMRINSNVKKTKLTIYHRDPPFNYSPVIITYLQDLKIEFEKDIIAEIAFLINKKILKLEKINNEYYISFYSKDVLEKKLKNNEFKTEKIELKSQHMILRCIPNQEKIKLKNLIEELQKHKLFIESYYEGDCIHLGYIEKGRRIEKINTKILYIIATIVSIPTIVILIKILDILGFGLMLGIAWLVWIISSVYSSSFILITNTIKTRTEKAKEEYAEWLAFIDFIKEYSYLNERKLQELEIWDDYLTYSIAFGVTKIDTLLKM